MKLFRSKQKQLSLQEESVLLITSIRNNVEELKQVNQDIDLHIVQNEDEIMDLNNEVKELEKQKSINRNLIDKISKYF